MIARTWVSRRTPQQVGQQQFALGLKARFKPCRDSAACTTVIRLQSKLPELLFRRPYLFNSCIKAQPLSGPTLSATIFRRPTDRPAIPNRRAYAKEKELLFNVVRHVLANYKEQS